MEARTYANEITYPRPVGAWEFVPLDVTFAGLPSGVGDSEKVSATRYAFENEGAGVDLGSYFTASASVGNVFTLAALFLPTETNRRPGVYRVELKSRVVGSTSQVEIVNLLIKVFP
jgi:hypothetical protein